MTQGSEETKEGVTPGLARNGKISYMQIPAVDAQESADFYERVFGWTITPGSADHASFEDAARELAGAWVTDRQVSNQPGLLPYIYVDRIDDTIEQITANGGEVVRPPYPEGGLWVATFRDPAGNVMGIWKAGAR